MKCTIGLVIIQKLIVFITSRVLIHVTSIRTYSATHHAKFTPTNVILLLENKFLALKQIFILKHKHVHVIHNVHVVILVCYVLYNTALESYYNNHPFTKTTLLSPIFQYTCTCTNVLYSIIMAVSWLKPWCMYLVIQMYQNDIIASRAVYLVYSSSLSRQSRATKCPP